LQVSYYETCLIALLQRCYEENKELSRMASRDTFRVVQGQVSMPNRKRSKVKRVTQAWAVLAGAFP